MASVNWRFWRRKVEPITKVELATPSRPRIEIEPQEVHFEDGGCDGCGGQPVHRWRGRNHCCWCFDHENPEAVDAEILAGSTCDWAGDREMPPVSPEARLDGAVRELAAHRRLLLLELEQLNLTSDQLEKLSKAIEAYAWARARERHWTLEEDASNQAKLADILRDGKRVEAGEMTQEEFKVRRESMNVDFGRRARLQDQARGLPEFLWRRS